MSGYKKTKSPIQIAQEQIQQLTRQQSKLKKNNNDLLSSLSRQKNNTISKINNLQQQANSRYNSMQSAVGSLKSNLRNLETRQVQALKNQESRIYQTQAKQSKVFQDKLNLQAKKTAKELQNVRKENIAAINRERQDRIRSMERMRRQIDDKIAKERAITDKAIRKERDARIKALQRERELTNQQIEALGKQFDARINAERQLTNQQISNLQSFTESQLQLQREEYHQIALEKQKQIDAIKDDLHTLFQKEVNQKSYAHDFLGDLRTLIQELDRNFNHQKYAPGKLNRLITRLNQANAVFNNAPQATISDAHSIYFDLTDLREEIIKQESEYNLWYNNTFETLSALHEIINQNREVEIDGVKGEADFWTFGKYSAFEAKVQRVLKELETNQNLSLEDIKEIHTSIEGLRQEHEELIKESLNQIMASQIRLEIAKATAKSLYKQGGFKVIDNGYEKDDPRNAYLTRLKGIDGTEVVSIVNPESPTANSLVINSQDVTFNNPDAALQRLKNIAVALKKEKGIDVSAPDCIDSPTMRIQDIYGPEFEQVYKKGIPRKIREQLGLKTPPSIEG